MIVLKKDVNYLILSVLFTNYHTPIDTVMVSEHASIGLRFIRHYCNRLTMSIAVFQKNVTNHHTPNDTVVVIVSLVLLGSDLSQTLL